MCLLHGIEPPAAINLLANSISPQRHLPLSWPLVAALPDLVRCRLLANTREIEPQADPRPRPPLPPPARVLMPPTRAASHSPGLDNCSTDLHIIKQLSLNVSRSQNIKKMILVLLLVTPNCLYNESSALIKSKYS